MSHITHIATQFKDLNVLADTIRALGWEAQPDTTLRTYGHADAQRRYELVALNPRPGSYSYDLGFEKAGDAYQAAGDFMCQDLTTAFGQNLTRLKQEYGCQLVASEWPGAYIERAEQQDGSILLEVTL